MIDLHCHVLDETGCGPESFEESLEMCRLAAADGVRTIVATPRWDAQAHEPPLPFAYLHHKLEHLQHEMRGALSFKLGFMMQFTPRLPALVKQYGPALALGGGRHILISLPSLRTPSEAERVWDELAGLGYSVIVSRPECSSDLRRDPARLDRWVANNVMLQIDAASVTGAHGREVQRFSMRCMERYENHVVAASNARDVGARRPLLGAAREKMVKTLGARRAHMFVSETPAVVIDATGGRLAEAARSPRLRLTAFLRPRKAIADAS